MRDTRWIRALRVMPSMAVLIATTSCKQKHSEPVRDKVSSAAEPSAKPVSTPAVASGAVASGPAPSGPASTSSVASGAAASGPAPSVSPGAEKPRAVPFDELDRVRAAVLWLYQTLEFDRAGEIEQYLSLYHPDAVLRVEIAPGGGKARQYAGEQAIAARRAQLKQEAFQSHQATVARALKDGVHLSFEYCYWPRGGVMDPKLVRCREESFTLRKEGESKIREHRLSASAPGTESWQQRLSLSGAHPQLALVRGPCMPEPNLKFDPGACARHNGLLVVSTDNQRTYVDLYAVTITDSLRPEREFRLDGSQALIWRGNNMVENADHRFNREGSTLEVAARYYDANEDPDAPFHPLASITLDSSDPIPLFCTNYEVRTLTPCHPERHVL